MQRDTCTDGDVITSTYTSTDICITHDSADCGADPDSRANLRTHVQAHNNFTYGGTNFCTKAYSCTDACANAAVHNLIAHSSANANADAKACERKLGGVLG